MDKSERHILSDQIPLPGSIMNVNSCTQLDEYTQTAKLQIVDSNLVVEYFPAVTSVQIKHPSQLYDNMTFYCNTKLFQ